MEIRRKLLRKTVKRNCGRKRWWFMSFQEFISDMKKLFTVCAICNFGAEIGQFGIMDYFNNFLFGGHINLFMHSQSRCQPVPFSLRLSILATLSMQLIPLYHDAHVCTWTCLELIGECLSRSAHRHWWKVAAVGFTIEANLSWFWMSGDACPYI